MESICYWPARKIISNIYVTEASLQYNVFDDPAIPGNVAGSYDNDKGDQKNEDTYRI